MKFKAKITYKVDRNSPLIQDIPEKYWYDKVFTYENEYSFGEDWSYQEAIIFMKSDLNIIVAGEYSGKYIYDVKYEFEEEGE